VLVQRLLHRIAPETDFDAIGPDEALQEAADLDSMDFLNLVTAVHEATGVEIPERDYPAVSTLAGLAGYIVSATAA
jgi:acyl carrier protein